MRRLLLVAILGAAAGCASHEPAPAEPAGPAAVLDAVRAKFSGADAVTVECLASVGGGATSFLRTTWAAPGRFREERWDGVAPEGEPSSLEVSDGTVQWLWFPAQKQYYRREIEPKDLDRKQVLLGFTRKGSLWVQGIEAGREEELIFGGGSLAMPIKGGGELELGTDSEVGGRACRVLEYKVGTMVQRFFVAKDDATPLRFTLESSYTCNGKTFMTTAESTLERLDTARPDPGIFEFTPPADAKRASMGEDKLLAVGAVAPEIKVTDAAGRPVKLADFRGKVVFLNFWYVG